MFVILNNLKHYQLFLKNKFRGLKVRLSGKISEKRQNDVMSINDVIHKKRDMILITFVFKMSLMMIINFNHDRNFMKKIEVLKTA